MLLTGKNKIRYHVLSDRWEDRWFKKLRAARLEHSRRRRAGEQGCQVWRDHPTFDILIVDTEGKDVEKLNIREFYPGIDRRTHEGKALAGAIGNLASKKPHRPGAARRNNLEQQSSGRVGRRSALQRR